ncbi:MAG: PAS domain S-box protein [Prolixibacteraceae bacterium]
MIKYKNTCKVLILEDDQNDKDLIQHKLHQTLDSNLVFDWTTGKPDFIESLANFSPDVVLSDFNLPTFNGFEALELTMAHDMNLPFILITGISNVELGAEAIKRGAWDFVTKEHLDHLPGSFQNVLLKKDKLENNQEDSLKIFEDKQNIQLKLLWDAVALAPNSIEITTTDGTILYVNSQFETTTGYSCTEIIGKKPSIMKSGYHQPELYQDLWETILSGKDWKGELYNKKKNGDLYWEETSISPVADKTGKIQYFIALKRDVTDRKLADEALQESRQLFKTLTQVSPVGIFRTNAEGKTTYVNPKWTELSGISFNDALGDGWINAVHPEDRHKMVENWEKNRAQYAEYRFLKPDGSIVWVIGNAVPELKDDEIVGYIGTITDISDRKLFEKQLQETNTKFQKLVEDISDVLFEVSDKLCISFISPVIFKITGFPAEFYIGKPLTDIIYFEDLPEVLERFEELVRTGFSFPVESRTYNTEGQLIWFRSSSSPVFSDNIFKGIRGIAINVSKQKEIEKTLLEAKERAEASDKLKTEFLNNISHEIRTPLNGILGFATMISEPDITDDEKSIYLDILNASSKRLVQTVNNFMDISLITSQNVDIRKKNFNPGKLLEELRMEYDPICIKHELKLKRAIQPEISTLRLFSDEDLISKTLKQLLNNALKFTKTGTVTMGAELKNNKVIFFIKDTGIGISPELQENIFDRFMKVNGPGFLMNEGSGLGLSIVKGLVNLLGGEVWVKSEKDKGSTFSFTIPYETAII